MNTIVQNSISDHKKKGVLSVYGYIREMMKQEKDMNNIPTALILLVGEFVLFVTAIPINIINMRDFKCTQRDFDILDTINHIAAAVDNKTPPQLYELSMGPDEKAKEWDSLACLPGIEPHCTVLMSRRPDAWIVYYRDNGSNYGASIMFTTLDISTTKTQFMKAIYDEMKARKAAVLYSSIAPRKSSSFQIGHMYQDPERKASFDPFSDRAFPPVTEAQKDSVLSDEDIDMPQQFVPTSPPMDEESYKPGSPPAKSPDYSFFPEEPEEQEMIDFIEFMTVHCLRDYKTATDVIFSDSTDTLADYDNGIHAFVLF